MLLKGGDTDTNACIVGGLIGAAIGFKVYKFNLNIIFRICQNNKLRFY